MTPPLPETTAAAIRERPIEQLRGVVSMLAHFIWHRTTRPGDHFWSIPVDKDRDWDCILTDAIDELESLRAKVDAHARQLAAAEQRAAQCSTKEEDAMTKREAVQKQRIQELEAEIASLKANAVAEDDLSQANLHRVAVVLDALAAILPDAPESQEVLRRAARICCGESQ